MAITKFEEILMMNVGRVFGRVVRASTGWATKPARLAYERIVTLYTDQEEDFGGYDDDQLSRLGLNVRRLNDEDSYWDYGRR